MFYVKVRSFVQGWNFSDPSAPPLLAWSTYVPGGENVGSGVQYGDGKVFPGSFMSHQMALDAKTGGVLWDTQTVGSMIFAGSYYNGLFLKACAYGNTFYCFDASNGSVLWKFNPGTEGGYFTSGSAVGYGMVFALNKDGHLYALDVGTGKPVWSYYGPGPLFFPGNAVVADGKVYATTGQRSATFPNTGVFSKSEFACLDAYTGRVIWKLPVEAYPPRESTAIAYGNLYLIPAFIQYEQMDQYTALDQVWAIGTRSWPMFRHDAANTGVGQSGPTNLTLRWNFTTGGAVASSPVAADGRVYFGSQDKNVYCVDAWWGGLIWKFNTSAPILSSPAVVNGRVYVGPDDGYVYCLGAYNGGLLWSQFAGGFVKANYNTNVILHSSPIVVGGRVYVGSLDNNTYCLDAGNGNVLWKYPTKGFITSTLAVSDGVVYVESQEPSAGALYALDAEGGALVWNVSLPYAAASRGTDLMASPSVGGGLVFAASNRQAYYGINASTGKVVWAYKDVNAMEPIICSPVYADGKVYLLDVFFVVCVDAVSGKPVWQTFLGSELYVSPTFADGKLYVVTDERGMHVINATDGGKLSYVSTPSNSWSAPTLYGGRLYVGNNDWNVYCFSEYPALNSSVTIGLDKSRITIGEAVVGCGQLVPGMANASVVLTFVRPDGSVDEVSAVTLEKGFFSFNYTPSAVGNWTVAAQWQSDRQYYDSASSGVSPLEVVAAPTPSPSPKGGGQGVPVEYFDALLAVVVIALIVLALLVFRRRRR